MVVVGKVGQREDPILIVGGNGAIQGFNSSGEDCYWTVTGDNVTSMILYDSNSDHGGNQLLVGSEDYDIRLFHDESVIYELSESDVVTFLCAILPETFAYVLSNGTVGVYHKNERLWRIKSKNQAVGIISWDINNDNIPELVTGWSSGKVDGRSIESGDVIFKDNFSDSIAALLVSDYNKDGLDELVVCSVTGEVRGYVPVSSDTSSPYFSSSFDPAMKNEEEMVRELMKKRQNLLLELRNYEETRKVVTTSASPASIHGKASKSDDTFGAIPSDTQLKSSIELVSNANTDSSGNYVHTYGWSGSGSNMAGGLTNGGCIRVTLWTSNETIVRSAVIFAEGIFEGESFVIHPNEGEIESCIRINVVPDKNISIDLHVKALVGYKSSIHYHVFELTRRLPKFSLFQLLSFQTFSSSNINDTSSFAAKSGHGNVTFQFNERIDSLVDWLNKNFILNDELSASTDSMGLIAKFRCFRDNSTLMIEAHSNTMSVTTEKMELAGDIVQSFMCDNCLIQELTSTASFPAEMEHLKSLILKVEEIQSVREQLQADIADDSALIRSLIIRAEDARLIHEFDKMKSLYIELNQLNRELVNRYKIRAQNHSDLVATLKQINITIQNSGNLRIGKPKLQLITSARNAIKQNNLGILTKILSS